jgi:hypothetical protein
MSIYRFVLRDGTGRAEELGFMPLADDKEAISFGETVVREMVNGPPTPHAGSVMEVTDGDRSVGSIETA